MSPAAAALAPGPADALEHGRYQPVAARIIVAVWGVLFGALLRFGMDLSLDARFFLLLGTWVLLAGGALRWLARHPRHPLFFPGRFVVFSAEVLVAAWLAHYIGASSWLATLFLLFPAIEWNMLYPGAWGIAGSVLAILASGALIVGEALGFVPAGALFSGIETQYEEARYAVSAFIVSASIIAGLSTVVGRYAEAGRRQSRELTAANGRLIELSEDLQASHTDLEEAYQELQHTQAELVNSARLATLGNLIAGVAHEINTPLGALHANHDTIHRALVRLQAILADEVVDEDELADVRRIVKAIDGVTETNNLAVDRMIRLVDSLRTFGRIDRSERDYADLHAGIESTLAIVAHELKGRIEVVREFGRLPPVECYPTQVHQMFMNLVVNAIQAIRGQGTLTIRTREEAGEAVIEVEDTGVGIPPENVGRIFDPGFTTKGKRMGMGMGLLITSQIVDRHGGRIEVDSEVGRGTRFIVRLPLRLRAGSEAAAAHTLPGGSS